jgi:threonine dehydrogenase-like Zn-dependent dehydrogenase
VLARLSEREAGALRIYAAHDLPTRPGHYRRGPRAGRWTWLGADLSPEAARTNLARVGWDPARTRAASIDEAVRTGATHVGDDWRALVSHPAIDIVVECTGNPVAAVDHILEAFVHGKHVVVVGLDGDARQAADYWARYIKTLGVQRLYPATYERAWASATEKTAAEK